MRTDNDFGFQWHITDRCPGRCRHCYQSGFDGGAELPVDGLMRIADCVMRGVGGAVSINVTGGEPLLYQCGDGDQRGGDQYRNQPVNDNGGRGYGRGVFELMAYLSKFDNLDELNIITAAYGMDSRIVDEFKALPKLTNVKVSLESHDPSVNDNIRGDGHFEMAVRNIRTLTRTGIPVIIMATLGKHNYHSVEDLYRLAIDIGAKGVIFERYVPLGRGLGMAGSVLASREWVEVLRAICRVGNADVSTGAGVGINTDIGTDVDINTDTAPTISIDDLLPYKAFFVGKDFVSGAPCCLGPSSMALMPDGTVYPCRRVPIPLGKLPDDGMERVLNILSGYSSAPQRCFDFDKKKTPSY